MTREEEEQAIRDRMREARENLGLAQADVAQALQIHMETYRKYETRSALPISLIIPVCHALHMDVDYLLTGRRRATPRKTKRGAGASVTAFKPRRASND